MPVGLDILKTALWTVPDPRHNSISPHCVLMSKIHVAKDEGAVSWAAGKKIKAKAGKPPPIPHLQIKTVLRTSGGSSGGRKMMQKTAGSHVPDSAM